MEKKHPLPRITDTGADVPCPSCHAPRLFPVTGLRGEELAKQQRGEVGKMETWLSCRSCPYPDAGDATWTEAERRQGYKSRVE